MVIESAANTKNRNNKSYHYYYFPLYNLVIFLLTPLVNVVTYRTCSCQQHSIFRSLLANWGNLPKLNHIPYTNARWCVFRDTMSCSYHPLRIHQCSTAKWEAVRLRDLSLPWPSSSRSLCTTDNPSVRLLSAVSWATSWWPTAVTSVATITAIATISTVATTTFAESTCPFTVFFHIIFPLRAISSTLPLHTVYVHILTPLNSFKKNFSYYLHLFFTIWL